MGQPEAMFISLRGLWKEEEVGSGRNDWTMSLCLFWSTKVRVTACLNGQGSKASYSPRIRVIKNDR